MAFYTGRDGNKAIDNTQGPACSIKWILLWKSIPSGNWEKWNTHMYQEYILN